MDLLASTNRFAVYFAVGLAWRARPRTEGAWEIPAPAPPATPNRVIDVTPAPAATPRQHGPNLRRDPPAGPTYSPAAQPGRSARLHTPPLPLGLVLDTWA